MILVVGTYAIISVTIALEIEFRSCYAFNWNSKKSFNEWREDRDIWLKLYSPSKFNWWVLPL